MPSFTIPTDNFYKFFAISGLIILISTSFYVVEYTQKLTSEIVDLESSAEVLKFETELQNSQAISLSNEITKVKIDLPQRILLINEMNAKGNQIKINEIKLKANIEKIAIKIKYLCFEYIISFFFSLGSFYSICFGFKNWYYKLQLPTDELLELQVKNEKIRQIN